MAFTFFFRDEHVLAHVVRHVVPYISGRSHPRIWDAGCAMGPEPYTLAIMLAENMGHFAFRNLKIIATDIDESGQFGQIIAQGEYEHEILARIPVDLFAKYFQRVGSNGTYRIDDRIRAVLEFRRHDLLTCQAVGEGFSLILCKNVLLHFPADKRIEVIRMFHTALAPEGLLAMEQTQKLPEELTGYFEQVTADAQLYRKREITA